MPQKNVNLAQTWILVSKLLAYGQLNCVIDNPVTQLFIVILLLFVPWVSLGTHKPQHWDMLAVDLYSQVAQKTLVHHLHGFVFDNGPLKTAWKLSQSVYAVSI